MIRRISTLMVTLALAFIAALLPAMSAFAAYNPFGSSDLCKGAGDSTVCQTSGGGDPLTPTNGIIHQATLLIALLAGAAAIIIMVVAGIQYITSGGDAEAVAKAKRMIIFAAVGLVLIVLAQAIINFVLSKV